MGAADTVPHSCAALSNCCLLHTTSLWAPWCWRRAWRLCGLEARSLNVQPAISLPRCSPAPPGARSRGAAAALTWAGREELAVAALRGAGRIFNISVNLRHWEDTLGQREDEKRGAQGPGGHEGGGVGGTRGERATSRIDVGKAAVNSGGSLRTAAESLATRAGCVVVVRPMHQNQVQVVI